MAKGDSSNRKIAIKFIFEHVLKSPEREDWKAKKIIKKSWKNLRCQKEVEMRCLLYLKTLLLGKKHPRGFRIEVGNVSLQIFLERPIGCVIYWD